MFHPIKTQVIEIGLREVYRFDNGYGASVLRNRHLAMIRGKGYEYEVAVGRFNSQNEFETDFSTPLGKDPIPAKLDEIQGILQQIANLPAVSDVSGQ